MKTKIVSLSPSIEFALKEGKFNIERVINACNATLGEFQLDTPSKAKRGVMQWQKKIAKTSENEGTSKYIGAHSVPAKFIAFNDKIASVEKLVGEGEVHLAKFPTEFGQWLNYFHADTIAKRDAEKAKAKDAKAKETETVVA